MPTGQVDSYTFGLNMHLIIGCLFFTLFLAAALFLIYLIVRSLITHARLKAAQRQARQDKLGPDGRPLPPAAEGLCDRCGQPFDRVYYLSTGRRLCPACYQTQTRVRQP